MHKIRCTFVPQAWVNNNAIRVDTEGETSWVMEVAALPKRNSYASDELRHADTAPEWVREWHGPFEVEYDEDDEPVEYENPYGTHGGHGGFDPREGYALGDPKRNGPGGRWDW